MTLRTCRTGSCSDTAPCPTCTYSALAPRSPHVLTEACFLSSYLLNINTRHLKGHQGGSRCSSGLCFPEDEGCGASLPVSLGCLSVFFREMLTRVLCPFVNCVLLLSCEVFHLFWTFAPYRTYDWQALSPQLWVPLHTLRCVLVTQDFSY